MSIELLMSLDPEFQPLTEFILAELVPSFSARCLLASLQALGLVLLLSFSIRNARAQEEQPKQTPQTGPATLQLLSSYEGQNVTGIEIAGRPDSNTSQYAPLFVQHAGEPFSRDKVDQTV